MGSFGVARSKRKDCFFSQEMIDLFVCLLICLFVCLFIMLVIEIKRWKLAFEMR